MDEKSCATTNAVDKWEDINFTEAVNSVKKLQFRIALAYRNGCIDKVCYLQHLLVRSFYARYLAVKFVASNRGKKTVGVDNVLYDTCYSASVPMELRSTIYNTKFACRTPTIWWSFHYRLNS